jgi:catalase (peroxidase I)
MCLKNSHILMATMALCTAPAFAWEHDFTRGLDLYSATDNGATIRLVCDPNRVYGGTETMVLIVLGGDSDLNTIATLTFPGGETITAPLVHGRLSKRDLSEAVWQPLLDGLRNMPRVELTVGDETQVIDLGQPVAFTCA